MVEANKRLIIVSGLSGSGKTVALHSLEDHGFYCIDNLPISFLTEFAQLVTASDSPLYRLVAVGIDARNPAAALSQFPDVVEAIRETRLTPELVFVEASDEVLLKRFSETRRKHPLSSDKISLPEALELERQLLAPIAEYADLRIDTTHTHVHALRELIRRRVARDELAKLSLQVMSFGFKHGVPPDADFVFDVRCLPNPHWQAGLRDATGRDPEVIEFLQTSPLVTDMTKAISTFLQDWIPKFHDDNRSYLTVAFGCTGGRHRSVYMAEQIGETFQGRDQQVIVHHRDM